MKSNWLGLLLVVAIEAANAVSSRKCFVCGPSSEVPFLRSRSESANKTTPLTIQSCDEFEKAQHANEMEKFIKDCPPQHVGCTTHVDGSTIIRTCDRLALQDCKRANGIDYCYCSSDLCNSRKGEFIREQQQQEQETLSVEHTSKTSHKQLPHPPPVDDEDTSEGSGQEFERTRSKGHGHKNHGDDESNESNDDDDDTDEDVSNTSQKPSNSVLAVEVNLIVLLIGCVIACLRN